MCKVFYALISKNTGEGDAGYLVPDYIMYCANAQIHPWLWATNARGVYQWWLNRSAAQVTAAYATNGNQATVTITIAGAQDTNTAVEVNVPATASYSGLAVYTNSVLASGESWRTNGQRIKVQVGTSVSSVQVQYTLGPMAQNGTYVLWANQASVPAPGVLSNASSPSGGSLTAVLLTNTPGVSLSNNGGFACVGPGRYTFTFQACDAQNNCSPPATVNVLVAATNAWYDDFTRAPTNAQTLAPWVNIFGCGPSGNCAKGAWIIANGVMAGASDFNTYAIACNTNASWTNYSVEARIRFLPGAGGGGVGGCLDLTNGSRYAAWVYPEDSPAGSNILSLVKFTDWTDWGYSDLASTNLASVSTNWHTIKLSFNSNQIAVYYDDPVNPNISYSDNDSPYLSGAVSLEMFNWVKFGTPAWGPNYNMSVGDIIVTPLE
jgi:hypothetical protein